MGEHTDNPENPQTPQDSNASLNPQSSSMPQGTSTGATVNAPGGGQGLADHSLGHEAPHGTDQPGHPEQPSPTQYPPWPYATNAPPPGYPGWPGEHHNVSSGQGYPNENPNYRGYDHNYPPYAATPPPYAQGPSPYAQTPPPYYAPYPPGYPPGNQGSQVPPHGGGASRPDINQLINGIANGDSNSLSSLGQIMNFDDKEFWKGALIGAAAVLLLTNDSVQRSLFRAGSKATQAVKSGMEKVKTAASEEPKASDNEQASDK